MTIPSSTKRKDGGKIAGAQPVPSVVEIRCVGALPNGKPWSFTVHGSFPGTAPSIGPIATGLWTSISSAWTTNLAAIMHPQTTFATVYCRDMTAVTNPVSVGTGTAVIGTGTPPAMPENAAIVMTENVAARGRGAKGRVFLGGFVTAADAGAGSITTAAQTSVNAFGTALFAAITAQSLTPCVAQVHRQQYTGITGTLHPDRPANHVAVTSYTCRDLIWDTQRRRIQL